MAWCRSAALAAHQVDVLDVDDVLAEPLGGEPLQLEPVARRRHVLDQLRWPRRCGTSASRSAPAGRGAARRAPCAPGSAGVPRWRPPAAAARPWPARTPRSRPRRRRPAPSCTSHVHSQTASRNQRSWVTTTSADGRRGEVPGQPVDGLDVEVVGGLVEHDQVVVAEQQRGQRAAPPLAAGQAEHRAVEGDPGQQLLDDLAGARVGRPLVVGAAGEHRLADRVGVDEGVVLVQEADQQPARPATPGRSRAAPGRSSPRAAWSCRRRCGRRRRSARPRRRRARRRSSSGRTPYAFETRSRLSEVRPSEPVTRARVAPATGPLATSTTGRSSSCEPVGQGPGVVAGLAQEQHRRPRAGHQPAQRALGLAAGDQVAELGPQVEGGRLEVVVERGGEVVGVAGRQRGERRPRSSRAWSGASGNISSKRR